MEKLWDQIFVLVRGNIGKSNLHAEIRTYQSEETGLTSVITGNDLHCEAKAEEGE